MIIYLDLYLLINFSMNLLIIQITKHITRYKLKFAKILLFSILTTGFSMLFFIQNISFTIYIIVNMVATSLLLYIVFLPKSMVETIRINVIYVSVTFAAAGCSYMIINTFSNNLFVVLLPTSLFTYFVISFASMIYKEYYKKDILTHNLVLCMGGHTIKTVCFFDTGNNLKEPVSRLPVVITNIKTVETILPQEITHLLNANYNVADVYSNYANKFKLKLIPYHTVNGDGIMLGFLPDKTLLDGKEIKCIIGITLAKTLVDNELCAILNPSLII